MSIENEQNQPILLQPIDPNDPCVSSKFVNPKEAFLLSDSDTLFENFEMNYCCWGSICGMILCVYDSCFNNEF